MSQVGKVEKLDKSELVQDVNILDYGCKYIHTYIHTYIYIYMYIYIAFMACYINSHDRIISSKKMLYSGY